MVRLYTGAPGYPVAHALRWCMSPRPRAAGEAPRPVST